MIRAEPRGWPDLHGFKGDLGENTKNTKNAKNTMNSHTNNPIQIRINPQRLE
jgi:hypothetical protein